MTAAEKQAVIAAFQETIKDIERGDFDEESFDDFIGEVSNGLTAVKNLLK